MAESTRILSNSRDIQNTLSISTLSKIIVRFGVFIEIVVQNYMDDSCVNNEPSNEPYDTFSYILHIRTEVAGCS
ncbi:hypothetical protein AR158_c109R [Paramecium bursaria Chlorella virus AR158]|uniref:hypothetical protein n=1 Tax=Paramecium bursaria Chlorella virus AR158 TaxID=380598 RepID=UPI00015AA7B3|nr:hypothetical protein AR158_c109R [Paramecium bursaria Chlorella virus AR158]ABU43655.1 hypothetical protein AR158_c109R [Paramecium bursaria Chlorella virus AR158]